MAKHDEYRKNLAAQIREKRRERDAKLLEAESLPYGESVKSAARKEIETNFEKSVSDLQSTQEYQEAEKLHKEDQIAKRKLGILNDNPDMVFDDNYFAELLDNLEQSECTYSDRKSFLNYIGYFDKLNIESFDKFISFCSHYNTKFNMDLLTKFSDLPYKELIRSIYYVDLTTTKPTIHEGGIEKFLDTIHCPYDDESFRIACSFLKNDKYFLLRIKKWHDLSVKTWSDCCYRTPKPVIIDVLSYDNRTYDELNLLLQMFSQSEIDEHFLVKLCGDCFHSDLFNVGFNFSKILEKYHLDSYKFCRYFFINSDNPKKYDFDEIDKKIKRFRMYCRLKDVPSFIPNDLESILQKEQSLTEKDPKDIIEYCENYELIGGEGLEYPLRKKFVILLDPVDKKLSCVLGSAKSRHKQLGEPGKYILGGGYFKMRTGNKYTLEGCSEEFGGFTGYENRLLKIISSKTGLKYVRASDYTYYNERQELESRYNERMGYDSPNYH